ncbi:MAG: hypothetical protein HY586_01575 [Candidatus Omnitrophica bacterium]|nr:hypothetical protein [Candidatus Omnitrophota bacterium]
MEKKDWLRVWKQYSVEEIKKSLLIIGELSADCYACKELGLHYDSVKECPNCGIPFRFVTSRQAAGNAPSRYRDVGRITSRRGDLIFIDYDDFKKLTGKSQAYELLGGEPPDPHQPNL